MTEGEQSANSDAYDGAFVRATYDRMLQELPITYAAHRWQDSPVARTHYNQTKRVVQKALNGKHFERVLEVGGGDGVWTELVLPLAEHLDFLDISEEMIRRAKGRLSRFSNISYVHADFLEADVGEHAYDLALSVRNLEYMPDKRKALQKYARSLKNGGRLVIVTKNPEFKHVGSTSDKKLHTEQIELRTLVNMVRDEGFEDIDVRPAIIGVGLKYVPLRLFWSLVQMKLLWLPRWLVPRILLRMFCESILVSAKKP